jgi:anti-sigma B factor antagonist
MNADLTIRVRREPGCAIVTVAGEIDIATVARLRQRLNTLADSGRHVIADLDQVGFMDASGLGAIVGASRRATAHGSSFQVVCDRRQTRQLFRLAGLDRQIQLARTLAEALQFWRTTGQHKDDPAMGVR